MANDTRHIKCRGVSNGTTRCHLALTLQATVGSGWYLAVWAVTGHNHRPETGNSGKQWGSGARAMQTGHEDLGKPVICWGRVEI